MDMHRQRVALHPQRLGDLRGLRPLRRALREQPKDREPARMAEGRWMDNVFIERLWRSLKYECICLHAFETGSETRPASQSG